MMKTIRSLEFDAFHEDKLTVGIARTRKPFQSCSCMGSEFPCTEMALCRSAHDQSWLQDKVLRRKNSFMKKLQTGRLLGSGGFGSVYEASIHGRKFAVKKMHKRIRNPRAMHESLEAEKLILPFKHPNIVRTFAVLDMETVDDVLIIMEFAGTRNLQSVIDNERESFDCKRRLSFSCDIARALQAIHSQNLVHLDLKPANVIVNAHDVCKLGDFGCCQVLDTETGDFLTLPPSPTTSPTSRSFLTGTFAYRAPELLKGEIATVKADIYSLGICLWQMLSREQPYGLESQFVVIFGVVAHHLRPSLEGLRTCESYGTTAYIELMTKLWQADATKRPSAREVMEELQSMRAL